MKRTVEIEDTLQDRIDSAIEDVKAELLQYCEENTPESLPCISNDLDYSGAIHEIIDGSVPIYTKEIDDTFYLYGSEIEEAFDDAGMGSKKDEGWPMGWKPAAIYCYIEQKVHEWYRNEAEEVFDEWREEQNLKDALEEKGFTVTQTGIMLGTVVVHQLSDKAGMQDFLDYVEAHPEEFPAAV